MQQSSNDKHLLCSLVSVKGQPATSTFHDDAGTEATQDASLVVLRGVQLGNGGIVWIGQARVASWARPFNRAGVETALSFGTLQAEYVATKMSVDLVECRRRDSTTCKW